MFVQIKTVDGEVIDLHSIDKIVHTETGRIRFIEQSDDHRTPCFAEILKDKVACVFTDGELAKF